MLPPLRSSTDRVQFKDALQLECTTSQLLLVSPPASLSDSLFVPPPFQPASLPWYRLSQSQSVSQSKRAHSPGFGACVQSACRRAPPERRALLRTCARVSHGGSETSRRGRQRQIERERGSIAGYTPENKWREPRSNYCFTSPGTAGSALVLSSFDPGM